jgi:hypothetical protein
VRVGGVPDRVGSGEVVEVITEQHIQQAISFAWASMALGRTKQTLTREDVEAFARGWYAARVVGEFLAAVGRSS